MSEECALNCTNGTIPKPNVSSSSVGWNNLWLFIVYSVQGIMIGIPNLYIAGSIMRYTALRDSKGLALLMGMALADASNMAAYFSTGVYRIYLLLVDQYTDLLTPWQCVLKPHMILFSFSDSLATLMLLVTSIDRLFAVSFPLKYLTWSTLYTKALVGGAYVYTFGMAILGYVLVAFEKQVPTMGAYCTWTQSGIWPVYLQYRGLAPSFFSLASVLLYIIIPCIYKAKVNHGGGQNNSSALRQQRRLTVSTGISCMFTFVLSVVPLTSAYVINYVLHLHTYSMVAYILSNFNPLINVFIYPLRHAELRTAMTSMIRCKQMPPTIEQWQANLNANSSHGKQRSSRNQSKHQKKTDTNHHKSVVWE